MARALGHGLFQHPASNLKLSTVNLLERTTTAMVRWWYLGATYSGLRASANRIRSLFGSRNVQIAPIHGSTISCERLGDIVVFVHSRKRPPSGSDEANFGMISVRQLHPKMSRLLYRYFCLTSHFGSGHMEIAFYEKDRRVIFHAVRNIARSNALRLGLATMAEKLLLIQRDEETQVILEVASLLEEHGFVTQIAPPEECVSLSVCDRLLHPEAKMRVLDTLKRKYERLHRRLRQRMERKMQRVCPTESRK